MVRAARKKTPKNAKKSVVAPEAQQTTAEQASGATGAYAYSRDASGRFVAGTSAGPGNPHARHCARMMALFRNAISEQDMLTIIFTIRDKAIQGDMTAAKIILNYNLGKPPAAPDPDQLDRNEWDGYQKDAMTLDEMKHVLGRLPSRVGNSIVSAALPEMADAFTRNLTDKLIQTLPEETRTALQGTIDAQKSAEPEPSPAEPVAADLNQQLAEILTGSNGGKNGGKDGGGWRVAGGGKKQRGAQG